MPPKLFFQKWSQRDAVVPLMPHPKHKDDPKLHVFTTVLYIVDVVWKYFKTF